MEIEKLLISEEKQDYKCYDELKKLLHTNQDFKEIVMKGYQQGKINKFSDDLWEMIHEQNIRGIDNFESVFMEGTNIGYCTVTAKQVSYSLENCYICGGILPVLKGSSNCEDGSHTWILYNHTIIDTTLMLLIEDDYAKEIGYIEENRYDPNIDPIYQATKAFTLDKNIKKHR